ncbi:MAG TPA: hypothetical protein VKN36_08895 [Eudoraea sp.]|nr:hypothetical protein [Eudoraea sp.]
MSDLLSHRIAGSYFIAPILKRKIICILFFSLVFTNSCGPAGKGASGNGTAYTDSQYSKGAQHIPGKVQCEYFDLGGEGVSYHDNDSVNSGSGRLNKPDGSYLHGFRKREAVDISYTKFRTPPIDNSEYNFVMPEKTSCMLAGPNLENG